MQALILIEQKSAWTSKPFVYDVPNKYKNLIMLGQRVIVPFGKREMSGFVLKITLENKKFDYALKEIVNIVDEIPVLNEELLYLGKRIAIETLSPLISSYQAMLPSFLKAKLKQNKRAQIKFLILNVNEARVNEYIISNKRAVVQVKLLKDLLKSPQVNKNKYSNSAIKRLFDKKIIKEISIDKLKMAPSEFNIKDKKVILTDEQEIAVNGVKLNKEKTYLLYGITGSGKTEVYIRLIKKVLKEKKTTIVLVPEISLTPAFTAIFKLAFKDDVAVLHSNLTNLEKYSEWKKIQEKKVKIVIGARSAIFAPLENIGIIIIDEEHSGTYKQESTPRYDTIEVAKERCKFNNCPLVLGSATPSLESFARAKTGVYKLLTLKKRPFNIKLPEVTIVDMKEELINRNRSIFSNLLREKIEEKLKKKEQIMILLNKRGYNSVLSCRSCGHTVKCPHCEVSLTYHKNSDLLRCHYCGFATKKEVTCLICKEKAMHSFGYGTEFLEEELNKTFPTAKTVRMDVDTTSKRGSHSKIISDFRNHKFDILIGTQMIAKGHDFSKVTLMAILNIDQGLNMPDFKAAERTFSLLNQASGRSGRSDLKGEVIVQTFNPGHYSIMAKDYLEFYNKEIKIRKELNYPPFFNLALIKIISKDINLAKAESKRSANYLKKNLANDNVVLGPAPSRIIKIKDNYYFQIIIKYKHKKEIINELKFLNNYYLNEKKVNFYIDFNPLII